MQFVPIPFFFMVLPRWRETGGRAKGLGSLPPAMWLFLRNTFILELLKIHCLGLSLFPLLGNLLWSQRAGIWKVLWIFLPPCPPPPARAPNSHLKSRFHEKKTVSSDSRSGGKIIFSLLLFPKDPFLQKTSHLSVQCTEFCIYGFPSLLSPLPPTPCIKTITSSYWFAFVSWTDEHSPWKRVWSSKS